MVKNGALCHWMYKCDVNSAPMTISVAAQTDILTIAGYADLYNAIKYIHKAPERKICKVQYQNIPSKGYN